MKENIKKNKGAIIEMIAVVVLLVGVFFISNAVNRSYFKEINYSKYQELIKSDEEVYVFVSDDFDYKDGIKRLGKSMKKYVYFLDSSKLIDEYIKEIYGDDSNSSMLFTYKNGKVVESKDSSFKTISLDDYYKYIKADGYNFIFIGSATCGYCTKFKPEVKSMLLMEDVNMYYLDLASLTEEELNNLYASDEYFTTEEWGTPLNFLYKDGERVAVLNGYNSYDNLYDFMKNNGAL